MSALRTSLTARVTYPAWAAETRAIDMVTVGRVLTCAQVAASRPMVQDRTMSVAVTSRISWFAKAFSCPRMTAETMQDWSVLLIIFCLAHSSVLFWWQVQIREHWGPYSSSLSHTRSPHVSPFQPDSQVQEPVVISHLK